MRSYGGHGRREQQKKAGEKLENFAHDPSTLFIVSGR